MTRAKGMSQSGGGAAMDVRVRPILEYLDRMKIRATYGAVGKVAGVPAQNVGRLLGPRCPAASWIVAKRMGVPSGYNQSQIRPDLRRHPEVMESGQCLSVLMGKSRL